MKQKLTNNYDTDQLPFSKLISEMTADKGIADDVRQLLANYNPRGKGRVITDSPWRRIPSVSEFKVETSEYNQILDKLFGVKLRRPRKHKILVGPQNKQNDYMEHQLWRIRKYKNSHPELAWKIAHLCITKSVAFRLSAFNHVVPDWYFAYPKSHIWKLNREVDKILRTQDTFVKIKRVEIPKANGKMRPLGVPSTPWRIVLHMWNNMLVEILRDKIPSSQHAYLPGKGTKTAWTSVLEKIDKYKYIYETDLKAFFDTVNIHGIFELLLRWKVPLEIYKLLLGYCLNVPSIQKSGKVRLNLNCQSTLRELSTQLALIDPEVCQMRAKNQWAELRRYLSKIESNSEDLYLGSGSMYTLGVPQGMPISPFLAILPLKECFLTKRTGSKFEDYVIYADDPIFFSNSPITIKGNAAMGIHPHPKGEKAGYIKYNGEFTERGFKFLGLKFEKNTLISSTRTGTTEPMKADLQNLYSPIGTESLTKSKSMNELSHRLKNLSYAYGNDLRSLKRMAKKQLFGLALHCMNVGDWTNTKGPEYNKKGLEAMIGKINKKSVFTTHNESKHRSYKAPENTDSSTLMEELNDIVTTIMGGLNNSKFWKKRNKNGKKWGTNRKETRGRKASKQAKNTVAAPGIYRPFDPIGEFNNDLLFTPDDALYAAITMNNKGENPKRHRITLGTQLGKYQAKSILGQLIRRSKGWRKRWLISHHPWMTVSEYPKAKWFDRPSRWRSRIVLTHPNTKSATKNSAITIGSVK